MNKKILFLLLAFLSVSGLVAIVSFLRMSSVAPQIKSEDSFAAPSSMRVAEKPENDHSWKTYTNTLYKFRIDYPDSWSLVENQTTEYPYITISSSDLIDNESTKVHYPDGSKLQKQSLQIYVIVTKKPLEWGHFEAMEFVIIDNNRAEQGFLTPNIGIGCGSKKCIRTSFQKNGLHYNIVFDGVTKTFENEKLLDTYGSGPVGTIGEDGIKTYKEALSTFRFTE